MLAEWWNNDLVIDGTPEAEIMPEMGRRDGEMVVEKDTYSAFRGTRLEERLREMGVEEVIVTGVMTNLCCETTAREAFVRGFRVFFSTDATATSSEELHEATLKNIAYGVKCDNSGERPAPSDGVPEPSVRGYMVWIKERARKVYNCYPNFSGEESGPDSSGREQIRGEMVKKASASAEIISKFRYKRMPGGSVLFTPEGYWIDVKYHFVEKPTEIENEVYYSRVRYDRQPDGHPGVYNQEALERMFVEFPISRDHYQLKDSFSEADPDKQGTPGPGSGSVDIEGGAESSVPQNIPDPGHESEPEVQEIPGGDDPLRKKRKYVPTKPPRGKAVVSNRVVCDSEGRGPDGEAVKIGTKTLIDLAGFMSSIPSEDDWEELGSAISICSDVAFTELKEANNRTKAEKIFSDSLRGELEEAREGFRVVESGLNEKLKDSETRAEGLAKEVERLKAELAAKENLNKEAIIAEFKASDVYDFKVAQAGVPEVRRSWVVAERHIKTDPLASWESFIQEFLATKAEVEQGQGEPEPYNGPSPSFL
ncbi:hypothetical protein AgCh_029458 [Apium graveolens]